MTHFFAKQRGKKRPHCLPGNKSPPQNRVGQRPVYLQALFVFKHERDCKTIKLMFLNHLGAAPNPVLGGGFYA